jgi:hypothetical protein
MSTVKLVDEHCDHHAILHFSRVLPRISLLRPRRLDNP